MDDVYAINLVRTEMREGYNTGEIERVLAVFANGFTDWSDGMPSYYGNQATDVLRARLERLFREYDVSLELVIVAIWICGDLAIDTGWKNFKLRSKSMRETKEQSRRYLALWQRDSAVGWKIVRYIDNLDVQPRLATDVIAEFRSGNYAPLP